MAKQLPHGFTLDDAKAALSADDLEPRALRLVLLELIAMIDWLEDRICDLELERETRA